MPVSLIAAMARNRVIGLEGRLPWRLPEDMAYFKRHTMGHAVVMGRKTLEGIGKPLAGRTNIVLSRDPSFQADGCLIAHSASEALGLSGGAEVFIIGGESVYALFLPLASRLYITFIDSDYRGDAFFPAVNEAEWREVRSEPGIVDGKNTVPHRFIVYERSIP
jgi:dihydrofolate reductase